MCGNSSMIATAAAATAVGASPGASRTASATPPRSPSSTGADGEAVAAASSAARDALRPRILHKTSLCKYFLRSKCNKGNSCRFAHGEQELRPQPDLRCTRLCADLFSTGECTNQLCKFAHTEADLRVLPLPACFDTPSPKGDAKGDAREGGMHLAVGAAAQECSASAAVEGAVGTAGQQPEQQRSAGMPYAVLLRQGGGLDDMGSIWVSDVQDELASRFAIIVKNTFVSAEPIESVTPQLRRTYSEPVCFIVE